MFYAAPDVSASPPHCNVTSGKACTDFRYSGAQSECKHSRLHPRWFSRSRGYRWRTDAGPAQQRWRVPASAWTGRTTAGTPPEDAVPENLWRRRDSPGTTGTRHHAAWALWCFSSYSRFLHQISSIAAIIAQIPTTERTAIAFKAMTTIAAF